MTQSGLLLFFDTETTGVPRNYKAPASDLRNWPRMVQVAWLVTDAQGEEIESAEHIVRPIGFDIPAAAEKIHGISTALALREGTELTVVLAAMATAIGRAGGLYAHNMAFDEKILGAEFLRAGMVNAVETRPRRCTMLEATRYCALAGPYGFKWPSLQELHGKLFGEPLTGAHRALVDVRACARCYFELRRLGVMN